MQITTSRKSLASLSGTFPVAPENVASAASYTSFRAVLWSLFFFVLFAFIFGVWAEKWLQQYANEKRNVFFRRGWVEHVLSGVASRRPGKLVIIISNSQGYGFELSDTETYPVLLEKMLKQQFNEEVQVLNWSVSGGKTPEFAILAAAAKYIAPDVLIFVDSPSDFQADRMRIDVKTGPRKNFRTDLYYLLGCSPIRKALPAGFLSHYFRPIDWVDIALANLFPPWRYREIFISALMRKSTFRPFDKGGREQKWFFRPPVSGREPRAYLLKKGQKATPPIRTDRISFTLLDYFLNTIRGMKAKKYFVFMPLHSLTRNRNRFVGKEIAKRLEAEGFHVVDLSGSVPDGQFLTLAHLSPAGHVTMAGLLAGVLGQ